MKYFIILFLLIVCGSTAPLYGRGFKDAVDREVIIEHTPVRIIPLAPSLTEILYYLGLGERVAGVTNFSYYPPEALEKPQVGGYHDLNIERIITLNPDLVIGTKDGNNPGIVDMLEQAKIPTYIVDPRNVVEVIETVRIIGSLCGVEEKANQLAKGLTERLDRIREALKQKEKPLVFLQINLHPIMSVNKNTFHQDIISIAGGINMTADSAINYPRISIEELIRRKPDVLIISSMDRGGEFEKARQEWLKWTSIPAAKNGRVYLIDSDLIDRPSPRILDGIEAMARMIHPEVDWEMINKQLIQNSRLKIQN
ncbi:MAG: cobalamin-binding protein [Deltaproteobacteria bacterium]|nr:cobalamin-binding protein [Deltaproteobacteria bacterium]